MARKRITEDERPRRRKRRMQPWQKTVCLVFVLFLAFAAYRIGAKVLRPVILCYNLRGEVHQLDARAKSVDAENKALEKQRIELLSREGAETEARKLGYVHHGEVPIILEDGKQPPKK
jgi:cell division protein FtsB